MSLSGHSASIGRASRLAQDIEIELVSTRSMPGHTAPTDPSSSPSVPGSYRYGRGDLPICLANSSSFGD